MESQISSQSLERLYDVAISSTKIAYQYRSMKRRLMHLRATQESELNEAGIRLLDKSIYACYLEMRQMQ